MRSPPGTGSASGCPGPSPAARPPAAPSLAARPVQQHKAAHPNASPPQPWDPFTGIKGDPCMRRPTELAEAWELKQSHDKPAVRPRACGRQSFEGETDRPSAGATRAACWPPAASPPERPLRASARSCAAPAPPVSRHVLHRIHGLLIRRAHDARCTACGTTLGSTDRELPLRLCLAGCTAETVRAWRIRHSEGSNAVRHDTETNLHAQTTHASNSWSTPAQNMHLAMYHVPTSMYTRCCGNVQ